MMLNQIFSKITRRRPSPIVVVERKKDDAEGLIGEWLEVAVAATPTLTLTKTGLILGYATDTEDDDHSMFYLQFEDKTSGWYSEFEVIAGPYTN